MTTPYRVTAEFWDHATLWSDDDSDAGHSTDGGRVLGITRTRYVECDHYGCKPVAVIDPEDRGQVVTLMNAFWGQDRTKRAAEFGANEMQAALRGFANPSPTKPDEPTGLGAVVVDVFGHRFVNTGWAKAAWCNVTEESPCTWEHIDAVEVLSEGVTL